MGKSRLLDEFSKHFFLIPINLRPPKTSGSFITVTFRACWTCLIGYPPSDHNVRDYLTQGSIEAKEVKRRVETFLSALFKEAAKKLEGLDDCQCQSTRIRKFREFMSDGQRMDKAGDKRVEFYDDVIKEVR